MKMAEKERRKKQEEKDRRKEKEGKVIRNN